MTSALIEMSEVFINVHLTKPSGMDSVFTMQLGVSSLLSVSSVSSTTSKKTMISRMGETVTFVHVRKVSQSVSMGYKGAVMSTVCVSVHVVGV